MEHTLDPDIPYRNPYATPAETGAPKTDPTETETPDRSGTQTARQRFSKPAITGMVIVTLGWILALMPFYFWIRSLGSVSAGVGGVLNLIGFLGITALIASVAGFTASLRAGNKKLAARLYIIPSLLWQLPMAALIGWVLFLLSTYDAT
ncbi:hypothetical protein [Arthrobacter sp. YD2]|uniref:hypothetical protein n=1 Tax=Arthrobacter sp. YD2 TaxID=3058046 RepID=UPI0025B3D909|nr:hypothetical protein [Arthrobacter sp. YD2]MDN3904396.1 hypothetical protein [Arthrobacter sp. YD2]